MALEPTKIRPGKTVTYNGEKGKVVDVLTGATGQFLKVNFGDAKKPVFKKLRPSQVALA